MHSVPSFNCIYTAPGGQPHTIYDQAKVAGADCDVAQQLIVALTRC